MTVGEEPAFPSSQNNTSGIAIFHQGYPGMTKHQFVATQAMAALLGDLPEIHSRNPEWVAREANAYASALIKSWEDPKESK